MARLFSFTAILASFINSSNADGFLRKAHQFPGLTNFREEGIYKSTSTHIFMESVARLSSRDDIEKQGLVSDDHVHQVVFVVQQKNMDELTRILHDVSDPSSVNYGQHMTKDQVRKMTHNPEARDAIMKFIHANGATLDSETLSSEYMIASAPISVWTRALNTEFYTFHQTHYDGTVDKVVRAERYWIPKELDEHVESVLNTVQMPLQSFGSLPTRQKSPIHTAGFDFSTKITPQKLRSYYNVGQSKGSPASTQGIFATIGQYFSPADLRYFFNTMGLPDQPVASSTGNHTSDIKCIQDSSACSEANLDVQYIMAASPGSPTSYMYTDKTFSSWLVEVANMTNPPLVLSISYGAEETGMQYSDMNAFSTEAIKMGVIGITIVVASGDDGAITRKARTLGTASCSYSPFFPASSPYVVSVGATSGPEHGTTEVVCQAEAGQSITSGGGFSTYYLQPAYQKKAVERYFRLSANAGKTPVAGYKVDGRGYPDISLAGFDYAVGIGGTIYGVSGTSASAPALAGFFSNINAARIAGGKGPIGWVNPVLYSNHTLFVKDITSGHNKCGATGVCCPQGFYAMPGWDPTTGLGSIDYAKLESAFLSLGQFVNGVIHSPTREPTQLPTSVNAQVLALSLTPTGYSITTVAAVIIAAVGAVILIVLLFIIYCCCCKDDSEKEKKPNATRRPKNGPIIRETRTKGYSSPNAQTVTPLRITVPSAPPAY